MDWSSLIIPTCASGVFGVLAVFVTFKLNDRKRQEDIALQGQASLNQGWEGYTKTINEEVERLRKRIRELEEKVNALLIERGQLLEKNAAQDRALLAEQESKAVMLQTLKSQEARIKTLENTIRSMIEERGRNSD